MVTNQHQMFFAKSTGENGILYSLQFDFHFEPKKYRLKSSFLILNVGRLHFSNFEKLFVPNLVFVGKIYRQVQPNTPFSKKNTKF